MGKYDYPSEDLKQKDLNAYTMQKNRAQEYRLKLAELESLSKHHAEQARYHNAESKKYLNAYNELKKDDE